MTIHQHYYHICLIFKVPYITMFQLRHSISIFTYYIYYILINLHNWNHIFLFNLIRLIKYFVVLYLCELLIFYELYQFLLLVVSRFYVYDWMITHFIYIYIFHRLNRLSLCTTILNNSSYHLLTNFIVELHSCYLMMSGFLFRSRLFAISWYHANIYFLTSLYFMAR